MALPCSLSVFRPFPDTKAAPPLENWMMMGLFTAAAASRQEFTVSEFVQFTAGDGESVLLGIAEQLQGLVTGQHAGMKERKNT